MLVLNATARQAKKNDALRQEGKIPAVLYGSKTASKPIAIALSDFKKLSREAGESTIFTLHDGEEEHDALIHEIERDPVTDEPTHVDFYIVEKGQVLTVHVPLEFTGEAPIEEQGGYQVVKVLHELEVEAKPKDLPHEIVVDISGLDNPEAHIAVKDISLPAGVVATADPDEVVVTVTAVVEEVEETPEEVDLSAIEVEKKGKDEEAQEE
jgi:large subunit ribosomal protein L25